MSPFSSFTPPGLSGPVFAIASSFLLSLKPHPVSLSPCYLKHCWDSAPSLGAVKSVQTSLPWLPFPLACGLSCLLPGQPLSPLHGASESIPLDPWCLSSKLKSSIAAQSGALEAEQGKVTVIDFPPIRMTPFNAHRGATQGSTPSGLCPLMINQLWELPARSGLFISSLKSNFHLTALLSHFFFLFSANSSTLYVCFNWKVSWDSRWWGRGSQGNMALFHLPPSKTIVFRLWPTGSGLKGERGNSVSLDMLSQVCLFASLTKEWV